MPKSLIFSQIFITDYNYGYEGDLNIFCNKYDSENSDVKILLIINFKITFKLMFYIKAKISCDYFSVKYKKIENDYYQCFIILEKKLNFDSKQNFIVSIGAKVSFG